MKPKRLAERLLTFKIEGVDTSKLRQQTAEDHERVEKLLPLMSDDLTQAQYTAVLGRLFGFIRGWEAWAQAHAPAELQNFLASRLRSALLETDLRFFGQTPPAQLHTPSPEAPVREPEFLGRMYVVEGSTLGGQFIARHVAERFHLAPGQGNAYFRGHGEQTGKMWNEFKQRLQALPEEDLARVSQAARTTFREFEIWMQGRTEQEERP